MMQRVYPEVPKSEAFPLEAMVTAFEARGWSGARYYCSTIAYMLAYALHRGGYSEISLDGVHMAAGEEYSRQLPAMSYWVGVANALGIKTRIPEGSDICKSRQLYAFSEDSGFATEIRMLLDKVRQMGAEAKAKVDADVQELYRHDGARMVLEKLHKEFS